MPSSSVIGSLSDEVLSCIVPEAARAENPFMQAAIDEARAKGIKVGMIRPITLWPFPTAPIAKAAKTAKAFISVELSMGQMIEDIELAIKCKKPVYLCNRVGGMIPSPEQVLESIKKMAGGND